jgi:hypothetical protein
MVIPHSVACYLRTRHRPVMPATTKAPAATANAAGALRQRSLPGATPGADRARLLRFPLLPFLPDFFPFFAMSAVLRRWLGARVAHGGLTTP